jgi:hypothetical protein
MALFASLNYFLKWVFLQCNAFLRSLPFFILCSLLNGSVVVPSFMHFYAAYSMDLCSDAFPYAFFMQPTLPLSVEPTQWLSAVMPSLMHF